MYGPDLLKAFRVCLQNENCVGFMLMVLLCSEVMNGELPTSQSLSLQEVHFVRSLIYISQNYFSPSCSLAISSTSNNRDVQQELIAEIHRTAIWPVVVTVYGNITKPKRTEFIDNIGS
jgi:hypothetical protein